MDRAGARSKQDQEDQTDDLFALPHTPTIPAAKTAQVGFVIEQHPCASHILSEAGV